MTYRSLFLFLLLFSSLVLGDELPDCGRRPENAFVDPMAIHLLLDLDATPDVMDQLAESFPSIAFHIATFKGLWFCREDGVKAAYVPDVRSHHGFYVEAPSTDDVRLLIEGGLEALPPGEAPVVSEKAPWYWTEVSVASLPKNQLHFIVTLTAAKPKGMSYEILGVLGVVRLRLKLKQDNAYKLAGVEGQYVDLYEIVEVLETIPERQLELSPDQIAMSEEAITLSMEIRVAGINRSTPVIAIEPGNMGFVMLGDHEEGIGVMVEATRTATGDIGFSGVVSTWSGRSPTELGKINAVLVPGEPQEFIIGGRTSPDLVARVLADDYLPTDTAQREGQNSD